MSGGSLRDWIQRDGLPVDVVTDLVKRIASALDEAHREGVIHRDLKPSNILLDKRGEAYLSDFGIVKVTDASRSLTGSSVVGTPAYMSPEQGRHGADVDYRADIYAFGVILFEMLTGQRPYEGDSIVEQIVAHATEPIPDIRTFNRALPEGIETVINQALAKRPEDRFDSMAALVDALHTVTPFDYDDTLPLVDPQTVTDQTHLPKAQNQTGYRFGVGALFLLLLGLLVWSFWPNDLSDPLVDPPAGGGTPVETLAAEGIVELPETSLPTATEVAPAPTDGPPSPTPWPTSSPTARPTPIATETPLPLPTVPPYEIVSLATYRQ